jgi:hypothetical protein
MSEIRYTPPATGGTGNISGTLTPTYIPYASGVNAISNSNIFFDVANSRIGIGTTNPSQILDVIGYGRFTSGVVGNGGLTLYGDNASPIGLYVNTLGNVGIGTIAPNTAGTAANWLTLNGSVYSGGHIYTINNAIKFYHYVDTDSLFAHQGNTGIGQKFLVNGTEAMRINANGNVGIGTTNPLAPLQISGLNSAPPQIKLNTTNSGANGAYLFTDSTNVINCGIGTNYNVGDTGALEFFAGGTNTRLIIRSNGKVGIGTTAPSRKLEIVDTSEVSLRIRETGGNFIELYQQATDSYIVASNNLYTYTNSLPRMVVLNNGRIGIGTTNPDASSQLHVFSPNSDTGFLVPQLTDSEIRSISSPADGLMVYNYDIKNICFFLQGNWQQIQFTIM